MVEYLLADLSEVLGSRSSTMKRKGKGDADTPLSVVAHGPLDGSLYL